mmetsp:Transcript_32658/g.103578  ORF Transcript_32658/g.103578 Transcript_32658/m.103578 type:complete len:299 (-) Transcript_32658:82-978(-)
MAGSRVPSDEEGTGQDGGGRQRPCASGRLLRVRAGRLAVCGEHGLHAAGGRLGRDRPREPAGHHGQLRLQRVQLPRKHGLLLRVLHQRVRGHPGSHRAAARGPCGTGQGAGGGRGRHPVDHGPRAAQPLDTAGPQAAGGRGAPRGTRAAAREALLPVAAPRLPPGVPLPPRGGHDQPHVARGVEGRDWPGDERHARGPRAARGRPGERHGGQEHRRRGGAHPVGPLGRACPSSQARALALRGALQGTRQGNGVPREHPGRGPRAPAVPAAEGELEDRCGPVAATLGQAALGLTAYGQA